MPWRQGLRYGLLGLPLAFVALPLYVLLPNYYARNFAVPLAGLGLLLLGVRLLDALIDPLLGRWVDALFARSNATVLRWGHCCWERVLPHCFFRPSAACHFCGSGPAAVSCCAMRHSAH